MCLWQYFGKTNWTLDSRLYEEIKIWSVYSIHNEIITQWPCFAHGRGFVPWQRQCISVVGTASYHMSDHRPTITGHRQAMILLWIEYRYLGVRLSRCLHISYYYLFLTPINVSVLLKINFFYITLVPKCLKHAIMSIWINIHILFELVSPCINYFYYHLCVYLSLSFFFQNCNMFYAFFESIIKT